MRPRASCTSTSPTATSCCARSPPATCDTVLETQADALAGFDSIAGIERYLDAIVALQVERNTPGCPIGSLAGQLVERDEASRLILADGLERWELSLRDRTGGDGRP